MLLCLATSAGHADVSEQVPVGPRGIAMGGAFSSLADDASALFWNPAGLPWIGHQEITGTHANLFDAGIKDNYLAFVLPVSLNQAVAIDWYHSGFSDPELKFGENRIDLAYGWRYRSLFSVGGTVKYLSRATDLDGASVRRGSGVGVDLGVLASPYPGLRLGLVGQDVLDTRLRYDTGGSAVAFPRNVRAAASYAIHPAVTAAFDVDDRYHLGVEATPIEGFALRAGMEDDRRGSEAATWTFGAGFKAGVFRVDYARVQHPTLPGTDHFALSMGFSFNPSQVRIERVETRAVYSSLYKAYATRPIATAQLRNLQDAPLTARVRVFVPELMDSPTEHDVILRPKAVQDVPLLAVLSERALARPGDRPAQVEVSATYQSRRLARTEKRTAQLVAYGPGAINWGEGVEQAAAFVTTREAGVDALAREVSRRVSLMGADPFGNRNISFAAALFDALGELGVAYVPDPNNPFSTISETRHAVDTIHYPRETLAKRTGDCDDTSVLMAALLGNVGVNTRLVDVPGHVFLLVETGLHERNRLGLAMPDELTVVADGQVWIPLETTAIGKGFAEAWRTGAESYAGWAARGQVSSVDVLEAQSRYEPAPTPAGAEPPAVPALAGLEARLDRDARTVAGWREEHLATRYAGVREAGEPSHEALNQIAHVYYLAGTLDQARAQLRRMLDRDPGSARAHNNLAATLAAEGQADAALEHLQAALAADPGDAGIWLNVGLVHYSVGDTASAIAPFATGVERSGGYARACALLGLSGDEGAAREGSRRMTAEEVRRLLRDARTRVPAGAPAGADTTAGRRAPPQRPPALRTRVGAARSELAAEMRLLMYWKDQEAP
jgi:hypothetical protein